MTNVNSFTTAYKSDVTRRLFFIYLYTPGEVVKVRVAGRLGVDSDNIGDIPSILQDTNLDNIGDIPSI